MKELADYLRSERVQRGVSLDAISERVRISTRVLRALEEGQFERIGPPLLLRSFIRDYCLALDLDAEPLLNKFETQITAFDRQHAEIRRYGQMIKALRKKNRRFGMVFSIGLGIAILSVSYGGIWISQKQARLAESPLSKNGFYSEQEELPTDLAERSKLLPRPEATRQKAEEPKQPAQSIQTPERPASVAQNSPVVSPPAMPKPELPAAQTVAKVDSPAEVLAEEEPAVLPATPQKHRLSVEAQQEAWVQVKLDGKSTQSILLRAGESRYWECDEGMHVILGNSGGVTLRWDSQLLTIPGKPGRVLRLHLPDPQLVKSDG